MNFRRSISWGLVVVLLLFAAWFVWDEMTHDPIGRELVEELDTPAEPAVPGPTEEPSGEESAAKPAEPGSSGEETAETSAEERAAPAEAPFPAAGDEGMAAPETQPVAGAEPPAPDAAQPAAGDEDTAAPETQPAAGDEGTTAAVAADREDAPATLPRSEAKSPDSALDKEATEYIADLAKPAPEPISGERADHFIGADQKIRFGPAGEGSPPGSTQALAGVAKPGDPPRVPSAEEEGRIPRADAESPAEKTGPTAAQDEPMKKPAEEEAPAEPMPAGETAPAGEDEALATSEERPGSAAAGTEPAAESQTPGEDRMAVPAAEPMKKADDDIRELVPGATPPRDEAIPPSEEPVKKTAEETPAGPMPAGETAPAGEDEALATSEERPGSAAAGAEPAAEPATAGKGEAAPAKTTVFRGREETPAPQEIITIRELLEGTIEVGEHDVFYVHAVTGNDHQGLWGIIQKGVTENFARGVRLTLDERTDTYRVAVPDDADEVLEDRSSSPLGLMIYRKSRKTIVYNRRLGRLTQDPDVTLYPGNELIIVGFKPEELVSLYKHFANADGG